MGKSVFQPPPGNSAVLYWRSRLRLRLRFSGDRCGLFLSVFPSDPPKRVEGRRKENKIEGLRGRQARALKSIACPLIRPSTKEKSAFKRGSLV